MTMNTKTALINGPIPDETRNRLEAMGFEIVDMNEEAEKDENTPTDDEIHFVAVDESNSDRHGWQSLNQKPAYVDGFEDGAKWMRNKKG